MNRRTPCALRAAWLVLSAVAIGPAFAAEPTVAAEPARAHRLRHDPFDRGTTRPVAPGPTPTAAAASVAVAAGAAPPVVPAVDTPPSPPAAAEAAPVQPPALRALLRAGSRPMVNVGGTLLEVGDAIDGFRLVAIGEYSARFVRDGKPVEVTLGRGGDR